MAHILLVDDDQINSKLFSKRLTKRGHTVEVVFNGGDCLQYLQREDLPKDLIIMLDIVMPGLDGHEVLKKIREEKTPMELPVIMLSGEDQTENIVSCLNEGANDYITKPANIDIAVARLKTQEDLMQFYNDQQKKKQLETINSMVATFNHEINNPLTIALGSLRRDFEKIDQRRVEIAVEALVRIADIVKKIERVTKEGEVEEDTYVEDTKMIKLK